MATETFTHKTDTMADWRRARLELLEAEQKLTRRSDEIARRRQDLPWVRIDKTYRFETDEGSASLADLFRGRSQLLVYHFMVGPDWTAGCSTCSSIADGFNGGGAATSTTNADAESARATADLVCIRGTADAACGPAHMRTSASWSIAWRRVTRKEERCERR